MLKPETPFYGTPRSLFGVLGILVTVILVLGFFFYDDQRKQIVAEKFQNLSAVADLKVNQIDKWRAERTTDADYFKSNGEFVKAVRFLARHPKSLQARRELRQWILPMLKNPEYRLIVLLDSRGDEILRVGASLETVGPFAREYVRTAHRAGKVILSDFHYGVQSHIHLDMAVPLMLKSASGVQVIGTLLLRIDPGRHLYPLVQSWPTPSGTAETLLVRRDGNDTLFLNELRHRKGTALVLRLPETAEGKVSNMAISGGTQAIEGTDYRGVPVLAAARQVGGSPWFLVAKIDKAEILEPLRERAWLVAFVVLLMILSVSALAALCWRHYRASFYRRCYLEERERRVLMERIEYLTRTANDGILLIDGEYRIVEANEKALAVYGYSREEFARLKLGDLCSDSGALDFIERMRQVRECGGLVFESVHCSRDGKCFPVENSVSCLEMEGRPYFQAIIRDISERKKAEVRIERLSRMFQVLSKVNHSIVHIRTRDDLIVSICRTLVETGKFSMAWVGFVDPVTHRLVPAGWFGCEDGCLRETVLFVDDISEGWRGGTGSAIRQGSHVVIQNIEKDLIKEPGRNQALSRGYRSSAAFPVPVGEGCVGALMVYAPSTDFFDDEIVFLLDELSANLSHALESFQRDDDLEASRERLLFAMKSSSMGSWDWDLVENTCLWDEYMQGLLGVGTACRVEDFIQAIHPVDQERARREIEQVLVMGTEYESKYQIMRPDGTSCYIHAKGRLYRNDGGVPLRMAGVAWDVTDRTQKSLRQRQQKELLRTMLDTIPVMICYFDTDGCLKWTNAEWEKTMGWSLEDFDADEMMEMCCPDIECRSRMTGFFGMADGEWADFEVYSRRGVALVTTWAAVRLSDETILAIGQDITERMKAREEILRFNADLEARVRERTGQLEEANHDLESFSYSVSHDLRAPLRAVKGFAGILREEHGRELNEEGRRLTDLIVRNAERMGQLIEDLLSFSRAGRGGLNWKLIAMTGVVASVIEELRSRERCDGIEFRLDSLPPAVGDEAMIRQVWMNLLANALKFTLPKGTGSIEIGFMPGKGENVYRVKDTGVGFDGAYADRLFTIFQRLHTAADFEGSGVGLAIVKRIVTRHGGRVWAEAVQGEGATFSFSLPREPEQDVHSSVA